jgi:capsid protein
MRPVLASLRQLAMYQVYSMIQARTRAAFPGFIKQGISGLERTPAVVARQLSAAGARPSDADGAELRFDLVPGVMPVLKAGQEPFFPTPGTPDTMYPPFVLEHLKGISAGTGLDFTTVCRWYADGNFSSQRQAKLDIWAEIDWIQDVLFVHKSLRRVRAKWMEINVAEGRLPATGFATSPRWRAAYLMTNWQGPPRSSIDEIKDEAAWDMRIKSGRASPQEYANEHGKSVEQVLSEIEEFRQLATDHNVADMVDRWLLGQTRNAPNAGKAPANPAERADGEDGGNGDGSGDLAGLIARRAVLSALLDENGGPVRP